MRVIDLGDELQELGVDPRGAYGVRPGQQFEPDRQRDDALLGTVVQIALDPRARLVGGGHDPRPRRHQLRPALGVVEGDGELAGGQRDGVGPRSVVADPAQ